MSKPHISLKDGKPSVTQGGKTFISDSLSNVLSGLNTPTDPRSYNTFNLSNHGVHDYLFTNPMQLYSAYRSSWLARQIVNTPAKDAMREWRKFTCKDSENIEKAEKKLNVSSKFTELASLARLSGGAIMVMMIEGQNLAEPLDIDKVKQGSLKAVQVFDRYELSWSQQNITDPLKDNFLMPEFYMIAGGEHSMIHHSNCIVMTGAELPRLLKRMEGGGWGDSTLRQCMEDLTDVVASRAGVAALLQKANVDAIKTAGLKNARTTDQEDAVIKRLQLFKMGMSNHNLAILDETEDLIRMGAQFGGTSEALNQLMIWISGAADIPMTRLFGVQSKGMGDTGAGDQKNYFDSLRSEQESKYRIALETLDEVMVRSALGNYPDDCEFTWNPLYQESGLEQAQQRLANIQADQIDLDMQVVTVSQLQLKRQGNDDYFYNEADIKTLQEYEKEQLEVRTNGESEPDFFGAPNEEKAMDSLNNGYVSVKPSKETADKIREHLESIGIDGFIDPSEMHVTLMYSKDGIKNESISKKSYSAKQTGNPEIMGNDPWRALVIHLDSEDLNSRHKEIINLGASHSYDEYKAHISLKYSPTDEDLSKLIESPISIGEIILDGESWEPTK